MKNIIIVGTGGVARETTLIIKEINLLKPSWNILGYIDNDTKKFGEYIDGYKVLGDLDVLKSITEDFHLVIAISSYKVKKTIVEKLRGEYPYATIIHPKVVINDSITIGYGTIIYEGTIITVNVHIGNHVIISPKCGIGHDSTLQDYVSLLWNVNISGNDLIKEGVIMGSASTIIQGKVIGSSSIIGAGAVIINDIPSSSTVVGVPGRIIKGQIS